MTGLLDTLRIDRVKATTTRIIFIEGTAAPNPGTIALLPVPSVAFAKECFAGFALDNGEI